MLPRLIKRKEVENITSLSTASIYRLVALQKFPAQILTGKRSVAWERQAVLDWCEERITDSKNAA